MSDSTITVVSGLPRSGTSLMMQMLSAGGLPILSDGIRAPDDDNPRGYYEFEPVKKTRQDTSWLRLAAGKAVKMVHLLLRDLPPSHEYRVILLNRDLDEVLASQRTMLERSGKKGADLPPERLAAVFRQQLTQLDSWLAQQPNFRVLKVSHRECIQNPASVASAVNQFLDGGLDETAMAAVIDPELYRQRAGA